MPYRRLPNTDASRIRAMKIALERGKEVPPNKMAFSPKTVIRLEKFLPLFEQNIQLYRETLSIQNRKYKEYYECLKKSKIYLTHFLRVMNMAIFRGELLAEARANFGISPEDSSIPLIKSENDLLKWGKKIIEGEESRIRKGGSPITNPTIAVVKVRFGNFMEAMDNQKALIRKTLECSEKVTTLRKEADEIILDIWNEVEKYFIDLPDETRKGKCEEYGLIYFYRKGEIEKISIQETLPQPL